MKIFKKILKVMLILIISIVVIFGIYGAGYNASSFVYMNY